MEALKHILLVDDNPQDVELALTALNRNGVQNPIDVVTDGVGALDYLYRRGPYAGRKHPCVVLLDLKMPRLDGIQVLRDVKNNPALKAIPIVMLTSSTEERDLVESYHLGVNAYVVKPVDFRDFTRVIRDVGRFWTVINQLPVQSGQ